VTWAMVFMLVLLKIPIVYLCAVVWWAIKSEPRPEAPAALVPADDPFRGRPWRKPGPSRGRAPRGPVRRPAARRAARARVRR
jgi:hypothetical protein